MLWDSLLLLALSRWYIILESFGFNFIEKCGSLFLKHNYSAKTSPKSMRNISVKREKARRLFVLLIQKLSRLLKIWFEAIKRSDPISGLRNKIKLIQSSLLNISFLILIGLNHQLLQRLKQLSPKPNAKKCYPRSSTKNSLKRCQSKRINSRRSGKKVKLMFSSNTKSMRKR